MNMSDYCIDITEDNYDKEVLKRSHSVPVLVDFWADWCQPCKMLMPLLAKLVEEYQGQFILAKIDTEAQQNLAAGFGIRSIPTVKLFKGGQPVDEFMGVLPEAEIRAFLDRHIPRESDNLLSRADELIRQGNGEQALQLIEQAGSDDPGNPRIQIALARAKAILGDIDGAETILDALPMDQQSNPDVSTLRARFLFDRTAATAPDAGTLEQLLRENPADSEALFQLAAHKAIDGDNEEALELLLKLIQKDREYGGDVARKAMLALFEILGDSNDLVNRYRNRMFNALH